MTFASMLVIAGFAIAGAAVAYGAVLLVPWVLERRRSLPWHKSDAAAPVTKPAPPPLDPQVLLDRLEEVHRSVADLAKVQMTVLEQPDETASAVEPLTERVEALGSDIARQISDLEAVVKGAKSSATPGEIAAAIVPAIEAAKGDLAGRLSALGKAQLSPDEIAGRLEVMLEAHAKAGADKAVAMNAATADRLLQTLSQRDEAATRRLTGIEELIVKTAGNSPDLSRPMASIVERLTALETKIAEGVETVNARVAAAAANTNPLPRIAALEKGVAAVSAKLDDVIPEPGSEGSLPSLDGVEARLDRVSGLLDALLAPAQAPILDIPPEIDGLPAEAAPDLPAAESEAAEPDDTTQPAPESEGSLDIEALAEGTETAEVTVPSDDPVADPIEDNVVGIGAAAAAPPPTSDQTAASADPKQPTPQDRLARDIEVLRAYPGLAAMLSRSAARLEAQANGAERDEAVAPQPAPSTPTDVPVRVTATPPPDAQDGYADAALSHAVPVVQGPTPQNTGGPLQAAASAAPLARKSVADHRS